jgi:hypothetical protein
MPDLDAFAAMSDFSFMKIYRSRYYHDAALAARMDQDALTSPGRARLYAPMSTAAPNSQVAKIASERTRRGLVFPDSWIAAGLRTVGEDS